MQIILHKNTALTTSQRFFIEKSLELMYAGSIDSYRVRLNNPKSILEELKYCLKEYQIGRIKHFQTIKAEKNDKKAIVDEAIDLLEYKPNFLQFGAITQKYLTTLLRNLNEHNYKKVISSIEILLRENQNYLSNTIDGLETLIAANANTLNELHKIDKALNILFSELISKGYAKGFLYKLVYGIFVNSLQAGTSFNVHFTNFKKRILDPESSYLVIFRIDTTPKVYNAISLIDTHNNIELTDNIDDIQLNAGSANELRAFNVRSIARKFIKCSVVALDYLAALKIARRLMSEYLDVINLGLADEFLQMNHRALIIDLRSPERGAFQNNVNILDGKYKVEQEHYIDFTRKLPVILNNQNIINETKEKIKSAVRYLRLGNESTEVEHKFINYWIGLEYLFSNYESQSTINRIKEHFINAHFLAYVKRNAYSFKKVFAQLSAAHQALVPSYTTADNTCLETEIFYNEVAVNLMPHYPLLAYRGMKLKDWFFKPGKTPNAAEYLKHHKVNLEIHFTRIYRLRNEIIHDAATNTNNEQIASNLRYYLTFILNELIDFLFNTTSPEASLEDYFILNEIKIGNIEQNGFLLQELLNVSCSIDFIS